MREAVQMYNRLTLMSITLFYSECFMKNHDESPVKSVLSMSLKVSYVWFVAALLVLRDLSTWIWMRLPWTWSPSLVYTTWCQASPLSTHWQMSVSPREGLLSGCHCSYFLSLSCFEWGRGPGIEFTWTPSFPQHMPRVDCSDKWDRNSLQWWSSPYTQYK